MLPAGPLMIEHRLIEQAVSLIEKESEIIRSGGKLDLPLLTSMIDFMRIYADRCHHGKEEEILFSYLEGKDMDEEHREMMSVLIDDHRRSRALTAELTELLESFRRGEQGAVDDVVRILDALSQIYPDHIRREDKMLFPVAMKYLSKEESDDMLARFEEFDSTLIHERYKAEVERMMAQMGARQ